MDNLHDLARAGEFCLQEAILIALEREPEKGLSVREIAVALGVSGTGCEKMIEGRLNPRLKKAGKVRATRGPNPAWILTEAGRQRRHG